MELLVVVGVVALLMGILAPSLGRAKKEAALVREQALARGVMGAYLESASANGDALMPGYKFGLEAKDERGATIALTNYSTGAATGRYPWRLAPYMDWVVEGMYADAEAVGRMRALPRDDFVYAVSEGPRFGLNTTFVGGDSAFYGWDAAATRAWGTGWVLRRTTSAHRPADLIVLASANKREAFTSVTTGEKIETRGYFRVTPPRRVGREWQAEAPTARTDPARVGQVDFGSVGKAVAAILDGHVEAVDWKGMNDMRRWADQAAGVEWQLARP